VEGARGRGWERRDVVGAEPSPPLISCLRYDTASLCVCTCSSHSLTSWRKRWLGAESTILDAFEPREIGKQVLAPCGTTTLQLQLQVFVSQKIIIAGRPNCYSYE
jgi:hypothetical protein